MIFIAKLAPAEAPQHFFLHLLLTADVPLWTTARPRVSRDLRLIGRCLQFFQLECHILSYLTGKHTAVASLSTAKLITHCTMYPSVLCRRKYLKYILNKKNC